MNAPIVLFVYNRPVHTKRTLKSLEENGLAKESELYIFSDGPKKGCTKDQLEKINTTRKVLREKKWCRKVHIIERKENIGLANSVIAGVSEIVNKFGKVIVLEDDLILSPHFLEYMNNALSRFEKNKKVMQISGYMFPVKIQSDNDAFFLPFTSSWGWATWKRAWDLFDVSGKNISLLSKNKKLQHKFDLDGSYSYYRMLKLQQKGKIDSWAIRFY
jgi:GT2 family glycosyltransferase